MIGFVHKTHFSIFLSTRLHGVSVCVRALCTKVIRCTKEMIAEDHSIVSTDKDLLQPSCTVLLNYKSTR